MPTFPTQPSSALFVNIGDSVLDKTQRKFQRLKSVNTEYGLDEFVVTQPGRQDGAIKLAFPIGRLCWFADTHGHVTGRIVSSAESAHSDHFGHRE